ncbi:hypothetical protein [Porphyromonas gulae]|uniref:hypothetical protein n=1 Tax=Porphyromonas gulae TaxID=111105 RepID=UPI000B29722B|nr:hypothetical protein [Porphyromonas gulae]
MFSTTGLRLYRPLPLVEIFSYPSFFDRILQPFGAYFGGGRATPYSDSGYAVERTELRSTAFRATLYGSSRRALRPGSAVYTAPGAELYGSARYAVERTSPSPTA